MACEGSKKREKGVVCTLGSLYCCVLCGRMGDRCTMIVLDAGWLFFERSHARMGGTELRELKQAVALVWCEKYVPVKAPQ